MNVVVSDNKSGGTEYIHEGGLVWNNISGSSGPEARKYVCLVSTCVSWKHKNSGKWCRV